MAIRKNVLSPSTPMKTTDSLIATLIVGCLFVGYLGHRLLAGLLLILFTILASWRFLDQYRGKQKNQTGGSGELDPRQDTGLDEGHGFDSSPGDVTGPE